MLFHTWTFVVFFAVFYPVFLAVRRTRARDWWLLIASYVFYGWWNPVYLILIAYSTAIDFVGVVMMSRSRRKKLWLALSIVNNILLLGTFKYGGFLVQNFNAVLAWIGVPYAAEPPTWVLPAGISFYSFVSMSYTIDYYRGHIQPEPSFIRFATFVSLFPHLVAGPIMRAADLLPQLQSAPPITRRGVADGLSLFVIGLFKKLALADYLAVYVQRVYDSPASHSGSALALATAAFGWQIYFDFSGYTDMARGIGRLMGYEFMRNFNHPYLATGLGDFWGRWHISLSTWFRDYVYIPLGGNRGGEWATYRNMCLTMLLSGLWHGAAWTFVIWGALHALGRSATRALEKQPFYVRRVPRLAKQALVFAFVTFTWIFFRAHGLGEAWLIVTRIFGASWAGPAFPLLAGGLVAGVWAYQFVIESRFGALLKPAPVRIGLIVLMVVYMAYVPGNDAQPFIYFQF